MKTKEIAEGLKEIIDVAYSDDGYDERASAVYQDEVGVEHQLTADREDIVAWVKVKNDGTACVIIDTEKPPEIDFYCMWDYLKHELPSAGVTIDKVEGYTNYWMIELSYKR